jgi:monoamine oxidase
MEQKSLAKKVIVLGAGLSGLTVAYETRASRTRRDGPGSAHASGQPYLTWSDPFADGLYSEAGAAGIIPVQPDLVLRYLRLFNIALAPPEPRGPRFFIISGE